MFLRTSTTTAFSTLLCVVVGLTTASAQSKKGMPGMKMAERGKYLVATMACDDCHSPKIFTQEGPVPDSTRPLSGHPANESLPKLPDGVVGMSPDTWGAVTTGDLTAWTGPWGTSFTANLTPDKETGLGSWTEEMFVKTIRTGKHMGTGRDILPPMPWQSFRQLTDSDLKSIFAYLKTLKPISNAVPDPIPPKAPSK